MNGGGVPMAADSVGVAVLLGLVCGWLVEQRRYRWIRHVAVVGMWESGAEE